MTVTASPAGAPRPTLTLILCFLAVVCEGIDIQSMGLAAPRMAPALRLSRDQLGPLFSASIVGLLIGAVVLGRLADRVGRKPTLVLSLGIFGAFSLITAYVPSFGGLLAVRLAAGLGLGGALPNLLALAAEAVAPEQRTRLVTQITCGMPLGGAIAGMVAAVLPWRDIFHLGGLAPLALAAVTAVALPESRAFVAARRDAAGPAAPAEPFLKILFGEGRAVSTLLLWAASFGSLLCLYVMLNWLPTLLGDKGMPKPQASQVAVAFNLGAVVGVTILARLLEGLRPRLTIAAWYAGLAGSLLVLAGVGPNFAGTAAAGCAAGFFISSAPLPLYGLAPGYYRVAIRGAGVGASVAVGRLGAIVGPLIAASLLAAGSGATGVLLGLLPIAAIAGGSTLGLIGRPRLAA